MSVGLSRQANETKGIAKENDQYLVSPGARSISHFNSVANDARPFCVGNQGDHDARGGRKEEEEKKKKA